MKKFSIFNFQFSILLFVVLVFLFLIPIGVEAGLVPCGLRIDNPDTHWNETTDCQICHLFIMLDIIIDFILIYIIFPIATLLIVIGGGMYMFSSGDSGKINQAKSILFSTIIGLVIIFSSWLLVNTFMTMIGVAEPAALGGLNLRNWWKIPCP